ncbi:MAG TPA: hypothetical protein VHT24_09285 [Pseudacidobacterium sp.]|jgi:hypothetical protein|nr:hypothetical protein [Pseudacidobacterium sp.]
MTTAKDHLASASFHSLDAMMQAYAEEAVRDASREYDVKLDYSIASIEQLESILNRIAPVPEADSDYAAKLWGSYLGEVFRRQYGSEWTMSEYPGEKFAVPTIEIGGSRIYPLMKVHRRLTLGVSESLVAFLNMVSQRLGLKRPELH